MKEDIAKLWVEALRSGKYGQARSMLRYEKLDSFCCLGVLCDISGLGEWKDWGDYLNHRSNLPKAVREWAGMHSPNGEIKTIGKRLSGLNDDGYSFEALAHLITIHWKEL